MSAAKLFGRGLIVHKIATDFVCWLLYLVISVPWAATISHGEQPELIARAFSNHEQHRSVILVPDTVQLEVLQHGSRAILSDARSIARVGTEAGWSRCSQHAQPTWIFDVAPKQRNRACVAGERFLPTYGCSVCPVSLAPGVLASR